MRRPRRPHRVALTLFHPQHPSNAGPVLCPLMSLAPPPAHRYPRAQCELGSDDSLPLSLVASPPLLSPPLSPPLYRRLPLAASPSLVVSLCHLLLPHLTASSPYLAVSPLSHIASNPPSPSLPLMYQPSLGTLAATVSCPRITPLS
ncbi:hypothetical protein BDN70DRAFT_998588 [Pholiota conissans]|uniref:Uncharacterized protein n=1 Tax=Pholiota conissans TaxID=109636 RepID=A0A9P6CTF4_9AGAR|nr:hypothetical protein BDN70DRAFT_998588 [Pholiota conissans]